MALLQNSFAAGLLYGRARFDQDFWKDFGATNEELDSLLKEHIQSMEEMPSINQDEFDDETDIEDFTATDDDRDPLDDIF